MGAEVTVGRAASALGEAPAGDPEAAGSDGSGAVEPQAAAPKVATSARAASLRPDDCLSARERTSRLYAKTRPRAAAAVHAFAESGWRLAPGGCRERAHPGDH